jgi:hypothetical protein
MADKGIIAKGGERQGDDFSVVSVDEVLSVSDLADDVSENSHEAAPRRPLPWEKSRAPEFHKGISKKERQQYYDSRRTCNLSQASNPASKAYFELFQQSSVCVENGLYGVIAYANTLSTDEAYDAKLLCAIVYTYQALSVGSTTFTDDPTRSLLFMDEAKKAMFRVAAALSYHKLCALGFKLEDYFSPKTVESMRGCFNL